MKLLNIKVKRAKSSSAAARRKAPPGHEGYWEANRRLLAEDALNASDFQGLRDTRTLRGLSDETKNLLVSPQIAVSEAKPKSSLFSQNQPQCYFHKSPLKPKDMPNLSHIRANSVTDNYNGLLNES